MSVITQSKKRDGVEYIINDIVKIRKREIACKDGTDKILYSSRLGKATNDIAKMMKSAFGKTVGKTIINSGYRTKAWDKRSGGSGSGPHTRGWAWDIVFYDTKGRVVPAIYALCAAELVGGYIKGQERINSSNGGAFHIDVERGDKWYAYQKTANGRFSYPTLSSWFTSSWAKSLKIKRPVKKKKPAPTELSKKQKVKKLQTLVGVYDDGIWGTKSEKAYAKFIKSKAKVKKLQTLLNTWTSPKLIVDGKYGSKTYGAVNKVI